MQYLHPLRWTIVCWTLLLFWSFISIGNNIPLGSSHLPNEIIETMPDGRRVAIYDVQSYVGWPFTYEKTFTPAKSNVPKSQYSLIWLFINIVLCASTLIGIVLTTQTWFPQFTLKGFLIAVSLFACILSVGSFAFSTKSRIMEGLFVYGLFFTPLASGAIAIRTLIRRGKPDVVKQNEKLKSRARTVSG